MKLNHIIAVTAAAMLLPSSVCADTEGDYTYTVADGNATITDFNSSYSGALSITNKLGGCPVTAIGDAAFRDCTALTSVTIPASVEYIGDWAFADCTSLTSVLLTGDAPSIDGYAFDSTPATIYYLPNTSGWSSTFADRPTKFLPLYYSSDTAQIRITGFDNRTYCGHMPYNGHVPIPSILDGLPVTSIDNNAFSGCTSLTSVTIPDSVTSIGDSAFYSCKSLTSVTIPDSVTSIGNGVFSGCTSLAAINVLGNNLNYTSINGVLFNKGLTTLIQCPGAFSGPYAIPASVSAIGDAAFGGCRSLTSVTIPDSITSIEPSTFYECHSLTSVTIPDSVTSIGDSAFYSCKSLTSVTIPDSVTSIGVEALGDCTSLTSVLFSGNVPIFYDRLFYGDEGATLATVFFFPGTSGWGPTFADRPTKQLLSYAEKNGGAAITGSDPSFPGHLKLPANIAGLPVTAIGPSAFRSCTSLTSVTIPDSVTSIGPYAFRGCASLTSVNIPDNATTVGAYAFYDCFSLASISIPDSVTSIGDFAFAFCSTLSEVTIPDSVTRISRGAFTGCYSLESVFIPNTVTSIGDDAFSYCEYLTSVTLPDSLTSIGNYAFTCCSSLTSVILPDNVIVIGNDAFSYCDSLTGLTLPASVTDIGGYAFSGCSSIVSVTIPNSVTSISDFAFSYCDSLASVLFTGAAPDIDYYVFDSTPATICYLPGAIGWDTPVDGVSPISWNPAVSSSTPPRFTSGEFSFTLTGNANIPVRIQACESLTSASWSTVTDTVIPASGTLDFSDPAASSRPSRFYRVTFPQ